MKLHHLHLPNLTTYAHASALQSTLVARLLAHKANPTTPPPPPAIITAQFHPVYTCGRREVGTITPQQLAHLTAPTPHGQADFHEALRGGQTTFHGPGQLTAYPIFDLRRHALTARCYVHFLEACVMRTCARYSVETRRTQNPGVWTDEEHKICAVGVHLRRNVSSHGVGLNVMTDMGWFERIQACGLEGKKTTSLLLQGGVEGVEEIEEGDLELDP
ncbi:hypothetical protein BDY17DRAFT_317720 [Neohortaea acidophila]|uniref:Octanoyltransferase n=1 Tax=Neohortaea acidophila TaxID=245834 RepID=A0A6A6PPW6_9PEZI|nr:uncharacterized protein BDY17DRAFT_317720 [Neohortaea acidophila]KAF2482150.1 hypothetical protein BDY17DRAFT_317720 [Neohortaea acidophila]